MPVNSSHPDYYKAREKWQLIRKVRNNEAECYLRIVDRTDIERCNSYTKHAVLTNFTYLTENGLIGLVRSKPSTKTIPTELEYLLDDACGDGTTLEQLAQKCLSEVLLTGRCGLLTDYPTTQDAITKEQQDEGLYLPRIVLYQAENIINWGTTKFGNKTKLSLIVLQECVKELGEDGFTWIEKENFRVLRLDKDGNYHQYLYIQVSPGYYELASTTPILDGDGVPWHNVSFGFIGAENNDTLMDKPPLEDLAKLNLAHYQNSADYEESIFICGQPMLFLGVGGSIEEFKNNYPDGILFGSRTCVNLGPNSTWGLVQANPNQLVAQAMEQKQETAAAIGARLIAPPGGRETAEAARIRFGSQNSALHVITENVSLAIEARIKDCAKYLGIDATNIKYRLNTQFYDENADPNLIAQQMVLLDRGIISKSEVRDYGRKTGFIDPIKTDEQLDEEAKQDAAEQAKIKQDNMPQQLQQPIDNTKEVVNGRGNEPSGTTATTGTAAA